MNQTHLLPLFGLSALLLTACGGANAPAKDATSAGAPAAEGASAAPGGRDPQIVALMKPALACKFEEGSFDEECAAYKAWVDNDELFAEGKGNETLLSMFADPDVKVRLLAERKSIDHSYFDDKARAARLFALAKAEKDETVAHGLAGYVAKVDAEKMGLGAELKELAKHPAKRFREALAFYLISSFQTPIALEVEQMLIDDPDPSVRGDAIGALSTGGITPGVEPVCKLLTKQLTRTDELHAKALWAGGSSKCAGMKDQVAAELDKRTKDPSKVTNAVGIEYALAAGDLCRDETPPALKKKGFEIGKRLTDAKLPDPNTRRSGIGVLSRCDPAAASAILAPLAKDKDKFVADEAKKQLDELKAKAAKKK
jgi:hypothetical protein